MRKLDSTEEASIRSGETFVKRIVEAVDPILPITLRNKSLDAEYLRTALNLLGAAELLFAQYETDIRVKANPAGVVGMTAAMHVDIEKAVMFNEEQKALSEFITDMKAQYLSSLGLGTPFSKDDGRSRKRSRRGRSYYRGRSFNQGLTRAQLEQQVPLDAAATPSIPPVRGRGLCYAYQAGTCRRGGSCRFEHSNQ